MRFAEGVVVDDAREAVVEVDGPGGLGAGVGAGEVGEGEGVEACPAGAEVWKGGGWGHWLGEKGRSEHRLEGLRGEWQ